MPETLNHLKFSKLKPSQFDEILGWDIGNDSFFRFLNPLKITKENLLGLIKNETNYFESVHNIESQGQALMGFTGFNPIHKTALVTWINSPVSPLDERGLVDALYTFCSACFKKFHIRKIQFVVLEESREPILKKLGAVKEGVYGSHFFMNGQYVDVPTYRLFAEELRL